MKIPEKAEFMDRWTVSLFPVFWLIQVKLYMRCSYMFQN